MRGKRRIQVLDKRLGMAPLVYRAGDTVAGEAFTRATTASYYDASQVRQSASSGTKRDSHYIKGIRTFLVEGSRTNVFTFSEDLSDAAWTKNDCSITANSANDGAGATTLDTIVEAVSLASHTVSRSVTATANQRVAFSFDLRGGTRTWVVIATVDDTPATYRSYFNTATGAFGTVSANHRFSVEVLPGSLYRIQLVFTPASGKLCNSFAVGPTTGNEIFSYLGVALSGVACGAFQCEVNASHCTSYIPATAGSTVTRNQDIFTYPILALPQPLTVLTDFFQLIRTSIGGNTDFVVIGSGSSRFKVRNYPDAAGSVYIETIFAAGTITIASPIAKEPRFNERVEALSRMSGIGLLSQAVAINGIDRGFAAQTVPPPAIVPNVSWGSRIVTLQSTNAYAMRAISILPGLQSLEMAKASATVPAGTFFPLTRVVFEGDSITDTQPTYAVFYPEVVADHIPVLTSYFAAVGLSTIIGTITARAPTVDALYNASNTKNILFIMGGENDLLQNSTTPVYDQLKAYCEARQTVGWKVIVATLLPSTTAGYNTVRNTANTSIRGDTSFYDGLCDFAADATMGPDAAASDTTYYGDGTHPTTAGHAILAGLAKTAILALL